MHMRVLISSLPVVIALSVMTMASSAEDSGKDFLASKCADCHPLESVTTKRQSEADWRSSVSRMNSYGLNLTAEDMDILVAYLTKNYGLGTSRK